MHFLASNVSYFRRQAGLSQAQLAERLGIKRSLLGAYEEARATPRHALLEALATMAGHSVTDLLHKDLLPPGYVAPGKRGRRPLAAKSTPIAQQKPKAMTQPSAPSSAPAEGYPLAATLTLTVDTAGMPLASLVLHAQLAAYGSFSHQASYLAGLPTLSLPMLEAGQPYRAFEVEPGQIHICKLVRNWASVGANPDAFYVVAYRRRVVLARHTPSAKGMAWLAATGPALPASQEEPLEIWQSAWVLASGWQPLPLQLTLIAERLAAVEAKLS
jgi:transcriptional regulator with XRE-family HTH domain